MLSGFTCKGGSYINNWSKMSRGYEVGRRSVCCSVWYSVLWIPRNTWGTGWLWRVIRYGQVDKNNIRTWSVTVSVTLFVFWLQRTKLFCLYLYLSFCNFLFYIEVQVISNVRLVSGVQQSDSVIHIHISILFQIFFFPIWLCNIK